MAEIIPFVPELAPFFRDLNLEWLEAHFYVEPHDRELLNRAEEEIIHKGGHIFFFKEHQQILGTFALIKINDLEFELGKMAVAKTARSKGIGQQMMRYCIDFSISRGWNKLVLYSNTSLENSIHIYKKYGFKEIPLDQNNPYARGNIKMEKVLNPSDT